MGKTKQKMPTAQQKAAVKQLIHGARVKDVATTLHVHRSTIWRWFQNPKLRQYAKRYYDKEIQKILEKPITDPLLEGLNSPNPWKARRAALQIIDRWQWAVLGIGKPPF